MQHPVKQKTHFGKKKLFLTTSSLEKNHFEQMTKIYALKIVVEKIHVATKMLKSQ